MVILRKFRKLLVLEVIVDAVAKVITEGCTIVVLVLPNPFLLFFGPIPEFLVRFLDSLLAQILPLLVVVLHSLSVHCDVQGKGLLEVADAVSGARARSARVLVLLCDVALMLSDFIGRANQTRLINLSTRRK